MLRLYHLPLSPFCRKVRLVLAEKKVEVELIEERYWDKSPEFLKKSPSGKIPILQLDGMLLTESTPICEFLEDLYPQPKLMPDSAEDRYEVRRLVNWFDDKFHHEVTSKLLYERINKKIMKQGAPDSKNVMNGKRKIKYHLDYMTYLLEDIPKNFSRASSIPKIPSSNSAIFK